jgi:hypothetical protein
MATTTNFGWTTPDDTSLVKDGAAAIRSLGSSIDTSMMDLKGGITGQSLTKNSDTDMDFVWATPASGGMTQLATGSFPAAATLTLNSISQSYKDLVLVVRNVYLTVDDDIKMKFNSTATSNYPQIRRSAVNGTLTQVAGNDTAFVYLMGLDSSIDNISGQYNNAVVRINDYANTVAGKSFNVLSQYKNATYGDKIINDTSGSYSLNTAITSIVLTTGAGNFAGGTYILYGVN